MFFHIFNLTYWFAIELCDLKVPSGQIGSTWEWYRRIGLYVFDFLVSLLNIWKDFKVLSRFMQKCIQHPARLDHGLHRILSSYWLGTFIWWKNPPKCCSILVWIAGCWNSLLMSHNPKNHWFLFCIFGARFCGKCRGLSI